MQAIRSRLPAFGSYFFASRLIESGMSRSKYFIHATSVLLLLLLITAVLFLYRGIQGGRKAAIDCTNQGRVSQIGLAIIYYQERFKCLPFEVKQNELSVPQNWRKELSECDPPVIDHVPKKLMDGSSTIPDIFYSVENKQSDLLIVLENEKSKEDLTAKKNRKYWLCCLPDVVPVLQLAPRNVITQSELCLAFVDYLDKGDLAGHERIVLGDENRKVRSYSILEYLQLQK
jgi:hypothetical protein